MVDKNIFSLSCLGRHDIIHFNSVSDILYSLRFFDIVNFDIFKKAAANSFFILRSFFTL